MKGTRAYRKAMEKQEFMKNCKNLHEENMCVITPGYKITQIGWYDFKRNSSKLNSSSIEQCLHEPGMPLYKL